MEVLRAEVLTKAGFAHGFALRTLDFRPGPLRAENVSRLARLVGFDPNALYQVSQVHGARVIAAEGEPAAVAREEGDALIARTGAVGVRVADCVPILVGDAETGNVAAIHAGWRGVVAGVIRETIAQLAFAAPARFDPTRLVAAIGPCIGPCCFEVGGDVANQIASKVEGAPRATCVTREQGDKAFVDLRRVVREQLVACRLTDANVEDIPGCTRCDAARFFSYRRDGADGGRHVMVIAARAYRT